MAPLCTPLPGESLPARARRHAASIEKFRGSAAFAAIEAVLVECADALERSYDDRQRSARLVVCGQCGHQVYSTVKAEG